MKPSPESATVYHMLLEVHAHTQMSSSLRGAMAAADGRSEE